MNSKIEILKRRISWLDDKIKAKQQQQVNDHWLIRERNALTWALQYIDELTEQNKDLKARLGQ